MILTISLVINRVLLIYSEFTISLLKLFLLNKLSNFLTGYITNVNF